MNEHQLALLERMKAANANAARFAPSGPTANLSQDALYANTGLNNNILTQLGVGVDNLQASLQRSIAGANTLLGNEDTAFTRSMMESAELNSRNAAAANFIPDSLPGAALAYTAQAAPGIAAMAAGGFGGVAAKTGANLAAKALGFTLPEVAGSGAVAGLTGASLANLPQHYGENINAQMENGATLGEASTGAVKPALINTGLDTVSTVIGLGALSKAAKPYRDAGMPVDEAYKQAAKDLRGAPAKAVAMGVGAGVVETGTEGAQQAVTLSMDPNSPFAFMDPGYNAKVGDAAYAGALTAGTIHSPGITVNAARALAPTPAVNETPQTGTVDVVDPATGEVLGSSSGPLMSANFAAMNEAAAQPTQYPQAEDPLLSAIRDDMGGRAVTINPIAENYLVHNLGITPTDAVSALSAVAPDEVENRTWSSDAVLKAASRIMEQQAQAQRDATIPTDGITEQDAIQGLLGQLRQTADIKSAFETARTRADDADVRLNSLIAMEERDAVRRGLETAQNQPDIGRAARDRAANEIARYNYERQQLLANQPAGTIHDMFGDGLFTEPNIKQSVEEEKAPFSVPPASAQSWLFDRNGNVTPAAQQVRDWEDNRPDEAALAAEMADGAVKSKAQMLVDAFALVEQAKREAAVSAMVADMEQGQEDFRIQERRDNAAKSQAAAEDAMLTFAAAKAWDDMTTTGSDPAEQSPRQTVADFPNLQRLDKIQTIKDKIAELEAKHFGDLLKPSTIDPIIENADIPKASKTKLKGMSVDGAVTELTALATRTIPKYKKTATELAASLPAMVTAAESTRTAKLTAARNKAAEGNDALAQQYRILASLTAEPEPAPQPPKAKAPKRTPKAKTTAAQPVQEQSVPVQQTSGLQAMTDEQLVAEADALRKEAGEFGLTTGQEQRLTDLRNEFAARKEAASRGSKRGYNDPTLESDDAPAGLNLSNAVQTDRLDTEGFSAIRATTPRNALGRATTYAQMRARIRDIESRFLHLPRVEIISTFMAAPQPIIDRAKQEGHDGSDVKGFFHEGEIYVVQDKVESLLSLEMTVFHEGFHLGLRQSGDGSQVVATLHNAVNALGGLDGIINLAKRQGTYDRLEPYLAGWADKVARGESTQNQANWMLLEETLAPLAEKQQNVKLSLFTKARKAFADLLRTLGFDAMADKLESGSGDLMAYYVMEAANRGLNNDPKGTANDPARYKAESQGFSVQPATKQPEGKRPPRRVLAAAMDALNGFLSKSGFGLGSYAMFFGSVSVVRTVSPEIADRMQEALRRAKEWMRVSTNSVLGTLNRGFDTYKMSDDDKIRTANYVSGEMTLDQIAAQVGKDSGIYKTVVETRAALRAVYEKYVQPAFLHRAIIDITNARDQAAKLDSKAGANVMAKAFSKHFKRVEGESLAAATARGKSLFIIGQDGLPKKTTTIPEGTRAFVMKHDRGSTHFPRVFDYDRIIGDKEGFIKQVLSAKDVDGKPFMESRKEAEALYNTLAANPDSYKQQDFLVRHETVGATRTGREMERAINLPNYVFGDYIIRDVGRSVPVYMQQLMNSAAFIDEFGAITHDSDGNVSINESSNDIANMLNGIPDIAVRQKVKRAVDAMFNPNFQTTRWGREMRLVASVAQFAAALAYMPLIVLSSFPEVANHIAAGRTKLERDVAKKVIWKTITNVFSESGRASNAMMRHRLEALGVINAEIVEHAMHGISQAQEMMGLEGKIKGAMGSFYQRSGITRFTSFQELLAGTIATEVMLTANRVLADPETSAPEKQQAVGTLARATGINPEQYAKLSKAEREALAKDMSAKLSLWQKASDEAGKELNPLDVVDADPALVAATDAVHKAINVGVGIRVAHANAGDVPFYFNDPIFKVVGQFKRFFYGATANVLPNMTANFLDGEWKDARDQFLWFAGVGMSAAAVGLMASHAIKYAAVAGVTGDPQTPFSVWQHKDDFASNLAAESALYATSGLVAATPYVGMMERPGGLLEPLNWAASAGLMTTVVNNPISLADNAGMAAAVWLGGDMIAKRMDNKYKSNLDKANQLGYKGLYTEGL